MTYDELMALPVIPEQSMAVWREDDDPVLFEDANGLAWSTARIEGRLVRFRAPRYDR